MFFKLLIQSPLDFSNRRQFQQALRLQTVGAAGDEYICGQIAGTFAGIDLFIQRTECVAAAQHNLNSVQVVYGSLVWRERGRFFLAAQQFGQRAAKTPPSL